MENEALLPKLTTLWSRHKEDLILFSKILLASLSVALFGFLIVFCAHKMKDDEIEEEDRVPNTTIPSMDFTVLNITDTQLSVKWDLLIRIPSTLGFYVCLEGGFQVFIVYKNETIATSLRKSYTLKPWYPKLLEVSLILSEGDMDGVIVKDIMEDVKERSEIRFGLRLLFPDCRYGTSGKMTYACDEATLRFEHGSQSNATLFGNQPICHYLD